VAVATSKLFDNVSFRPSSTRESSSTHRIDVRKIVIGVKRPPGCRATCARVLPATPKTLEIASPERAQPTATASSLPGSVRRPAVFPRAMLERCRPRSGRRRTFAQLAQGPRAEQRPLRSGTEAPIERANRPPQYRDRLRRISVQHRQAAFPPRSPRAHAASHPCTLVREAIGRRHAEDRRETPPRPNWFQPPVTELSQPRSARASAI